MRIGTHCFKGLSFRCSILPRVPRSIRVAGVSVVSTRPGTTGDGTVGLTHKGPAYVNCTCVVFVDCRPSSGRSRVCIGSRSFSGRGEGSLLYSRLDQVPSLGHRLCLWVRGPFWALSGRHISFVSGVEGVARTH